MSADTPRSERTMRFAPCSIAAHARSINDLIASSSPLDPRAAGKSIGKVTAQKPRHPSNCLSRASSSLSRIGSSSAICRQLSAVGSSKFPSPPAPVNTEVTSSSRIASSGGFVTWANSCLK